MSCQRRGAAARVGSAPLMSRKKRKKSRGSASPSASGSAVALALGLSYDVEALVKARKESQSPLTIVCSPNNPTGSGIDPEGIQRILKKAPNAAVAAAAAPTAAPRWRRRK